MITYAVEDYFSTRAEIDALLPLHYDEIAMDKDVIPLDKDEKRYTDLANAGKLHIIVVRCDGMMIGYHAYIIESHLHYKSSLMAFTDVFFLKSEYRRGGVGRKMFAYGEDSLKRRGVVKIFVTCKKHLDVTELFLSLGWQVSDIVFSKPLITTGE